MVVCSNWSDTDPDFDECVVIPSKLPHRKGLTRSTSYQRLVTRNKKRPWLAAIFAFIYPGFGHLYLRQWLRAFLWFGFAILTAFVFIPPDVIQYVEAHGWSAYLHGKKTVPLDSYLPILFVSICNIIDAYWSALRNNRTVQETVDGTMRCPNCGRKVDPDFDFCQWCSESLTTETENAR